MIINANECKLTYKNNLVLLLHISVSVTLSSGIFTQRSQNLLKYNKGGSNMTGTDFFVTIIAHHSSNSQTGLNRL